MSGQIDLDEVVCAAPELERFVGVAAAAVGADADIGNELAGHLVGANLAGHDSHGVLRLPRYVDEVGRGQVVPEARPTVIRDGGALALIDANRGFGHFSTAFALGWCLQRARRTGVAVAALRHANHIGRLGHYTERAAAAGMIGIVTAGSAGPGNGVVTPFGGAGRFLGTNPWSIAIPTATGGPVVVDVATSSIPEGKVRMAAARGLSVPPEMLLDADGVATTDPRQLYQGGFLTGLGGAAAGHKGYGLGLAAALLSGLSMIDDPDPTPAGMAAIPPDWKGKVAGIVVLVLDPGWFGHADSYAAMVDDVLVGLREVPPVPGTASVLVPGEPEARTRAARLRDGIPLPAPIWADLIEVADRLKVARPRPGTPNPRAGDG